MSSYLEDKGDRLVLPDLVIPNRYLLEYKSIDLKQFTFSGTVSIELQVKRATNKIILHAIEIDVKDALIKQQSVTHEEKAIKVEYDTKDEVAIITFAKELVVGSVATLVINFSGMLNDKLKGFYRSPYIVSGETRYMGVTQFEATDARRAFPCFDEPALKAEFDILITIPQHLTAISNQPESSTLVNGDGTHTISFVRTPKMSTYIVAFAIGEFEFVEGKTKSGIVTRIYQLIGKEEKGDFALEVAVKVLDFFEDYFQIPYPLRKIDHLAVGAFAFGAMENFSLIIYRESALLTSSKTSLKTKQRIANVIGHELAHQWFGNLVTMDWWSQLWLNEGFASYMGVMVTDRLFPEWNQWLDCEFRTDVMDLDGLESSHPIEVKVHESSQITEIFDAISYKKGASVIQMLDFRYGDAFRQGLNHYLTKFAWQNANTQDLWDSISLKANDNVKDFIDNYTKITGYPVITFSLIPSSPSSSKTSTTLSYLVSQRKFNYLKKDTTQQQDTWKCFIPIQKASSKKGEFQSVLLDPSKKDSVIFKVEKGEWFKPNYKESGYYRIQYNKEIIAALVPAIESLEISSVDRLGILVDTFALSRSCQTPINVFMDLVASYKNETECLVWTHIVDKLTLILNIVYDQPYKDLLKTFIVQLVVPIYNRLGFNNKDGEPSNDSLLRAKINSCLGLLGYEPVVDECKKRFDLYYNGTQPLSNDLASVVLTTVVRHGDETVLDKVIQLHKKASAVAEKNSLLLCMGVSQIPHCVEKALTYSLDPNHVKTQDTYMVWFGIGNDQRDVAFKYFADNFDKIDAIFKQNMLYARLITSSLPRRLPEQELIAKEKFLLHDKSLPLCLRTIKQSIESITINNHWFNYFSSDLSNWFKNQNK
ncbi:hypothetical protein DFA_02449 [Cavenderia fasciculata]|uniref:Aminopeptidase n=1 Tax=Cavenderia fasciculata TaxID=261658 RepID=F4PZH2_CACFS|nr:uncharacterized protein DFA_02449 [Cavenderia fasciculata]EGG19201.1 hypothetical protein DFA_02449 [Cavenderia fasciculata]|eukprot:XP_004366834.1 hypothetical protein DFA_02449 [Cavenderia fasciculata]